MKLYKILIFTLLFLSAGASYAAENSDDALIQQADSAYSRGEYTKSEKLYNEIIEKNGETATLLYNLANSCYKAGNEGYARLYLERAKRLDPSNEKINNNLDYLSTRINDANKAELKGKKGSVTPDEPGFFGKVKQSVAVDTSSNAWAEMAATAFILMILALAIYFFNENVRFKKIGFFSAIIFAFFSAIFIIFAEMGASQFESKDEAIMTSFKSTLKSEPAPNSKDVGFPLHRGTKFDILDTQLEPDGEIGWYKVKLNNANIGWLPAADLTVI